MRRILPFLLLAVFASGLYGCGYNEMQAKEEGVFAAWGDVEAAYQRRTDLVPNLVEIVKGYAKHESETLKAVTEARAKVGSVQVSKEMLAKPEQMAHFQQAQSQLGSALSRLLVVSEQYPNLKANQNFMDLQNQARRNGEQDKRGQGQVQPGRAGVQRQHPHLSQLHDQLAAPPSGEERALQSGRGGKDCTQSQILGMP